MQLFDRSREPECKHVFFSFLFSGDLHIDGQVPNSDIDLVAYSGGFDAVCCEPILLLLTGGSCCKGLAPPCANSTSSLAVADHFNLLLL
jgi:hypothetical protein